MRVLHTADWHVGRQMRGRSRADEHRAVLREIAEIADREQVDIVLIAGDQFDVKAPTPEAEAILYQAMLDLADTGAHVLAVAGNHDNAHRVAAVEPVFHRSRVITTPMVARPEDGGVVTVNTRSGGTAKVIMLPWLSKRGVVTADALMSGNTADYHAKYAQHMRDIITHLTGHAGKDDADAHLLLSHLTVSSGLLGGGERQAHTYIDYHVPAAAFPDWLSYVALGHLHRPQQVTGPCPIHYAGSPMFLDFGEEGDDAVVKLIDIEPGLPAQVRDIRLKSPVRLRTMTGSFEEVLAKPSQDVEYLRVRVTDHPRPGLIDDVYERFPNAVDVQVVTPGSPSRLGQKRMSESRLGKPPRDLFAEYLKETIGSADPALLTMFDELDEEVSGGDTVEAASA